MAAMNKHAQQGCVAGSCEAWLTIGARANARRVHIDRIALRLELEQAVGVARRRRQGEREGPTQLAHILMGVYMAEAAARPSVSESAHHSRAA